MTRKQGLIASAIASLLLLAAMYPAERRMEDTGGPGIVTYEMVGSQDRAEEIFAEWGDKGQDAARQSLWIDFAYMLAYGTFFTLAAAATRDLARRRSWRRMASVGGVVIACGALSAGFDALENISLLLTLGGAGSAFPTLATIFASCKFLLIAIAIGYLLTGLAMRLFGPGGGVAESEQAA
jgi:nitrate/nitrite transporter NarK